jgi:ribonucleoside-diphosphate reductase alpha chain
MLQQESIAFESLQAMYKNQELFQHIWERAEAASIYLGQVLGSTEKCAPLNRRNAHLIAIAPNTSSALLCGGVSQGIEPIVANAFSQSGAQGEITRVSPVFLKLAKDRGQYTEQLKEDILDHQGSVQHLTWLTDNEKAVFKTAFEINQSAIIRLASQRQEYIDQGQSINLFFAADEQEEYIAQIHQEAFLDPNIKSLYYLRTQAGVQASKDCVACEG